MCERAVVRPVIFTLLRGERPDRVPGELERYRRDYWVEITADGDDLIARLRARADAGEPVAMVLADLGLADGHGVDVFRRVRATAPAARCILLLEWGLRPDQTAAAARAAALGVVDLVLTKPTGPRDEEFHGALVEELADWSWTTAPVVEAVKVVDDADATRGREIQRRLERLGVPTGLHTPDSDAGRAVAAAAGPERPLPLVEVMGARVLADPSDREIAEAFGVAVDVGATVFDVAVVGAGPAGLGAAVYAASEGLTTLILEGEAFGGQAGASSMIRNYLGFPRGISGRQLGRRAVVQAAAFGAALDLGRRAVGLEPGEPHRLRLDDGAVVSAGAVILACGVTYRRLGVDALEALVGAGVFYGAAASRARDLDAAEVVVVGAGNSGGQAAVHLARYAGRVTLVARGPSLADTMSAYLVDEIASQSRIDVRTGTDVVDGGGDGVLQWVTLADRATGAGERLPASAMFVMIGTETRTDWLPAAVARDDHGFVLTGADVESEHWPLARAPFALETSVPGVFAAGDVRANDVKRVAAAAGEGAVSVPMVHRFLAQRRGTT
jgi:thioredoxin reductase (NADPH)